MWMSVRDVCSESNLESSHPQVNVHKQIGMGVEYIIKNALLRRSLDNVTVVVIAFEAFMRKIAQPSMVEDKTQKHSVEFKLH